MYSRHAGLRDSPGYPRDPPWQPGVLDEEWESSCFEHNPGKHVTSRRKEGLPVYQ